MKSFTALVSEHQLVSGSFQYLHLELVRPDRIEFQAGQYLILTIDAQKGLRRNYSIASPPEMNHAVELLVDVKPQGPGSEYLKNLKPGDKVEFVAPFGNFIVAPECSIVHRPSFIVHELLLAATGSGISPVRSMIIDLLQAKKYQGPVRLWWGMRQPEDCFWIEDFDNLEKEYPNFKWDLVLSQPPQNWPLHSGHVTSHVLEYVREAIRAKSEEQSQSQHLALSSYNLCLYLCGNRFMIEEVSTKLAEIGINREHIHTEKFF